MNDKIKVLFLDLDNTLLDFDAAASWAMEQCFQKAGLEYKSEMFAAFTEENNKIWQRIERKELTMDDLFYVRWQAILGHLGLEADGVEMEKEFRGKSLSIKVQNPSHVSSGVKEVTLNGEKLESNFINANLLKEKNDINVVLGE